MLCLSELIFAFFKISLPHPNNDKSNLENSGVFMISNIYKKQLKDTRSSICKEYDSWLDEYFTELCRALLCDIDNIQWSEPYESIFKYVLLLTKFHISQIFLSFRTFLHNYTKLYYENLFDKPLDRALSADLFRKAAIFYESILMTNYELDSKSIIIIIEKHDCKCLSDLRVIFKNKNSKIIKNLIISFNYIIEEYIKCVIE